MRITKTTRVINIADHFVSWRSHLFIRIVLKVYGRRYSDGRIIISYDRTSFPGKSKSEFHTNIRLYEWCDEATTTEVVWSFPWIPWIFERIYMESKTFRIDIIRKDIHPIIIVIERNSTISSRKYFSIASPVTLAYPGIDIPIEDSIISTRASCTIMAHSEV